MSASASGVPGLPKIKRHVTGHDASGKSVYIDVPEYSVGVMPGTGAHYRSYAMEGLPVDMRQDADLKAFSSADDDNSASHVRHEVALSKPGFNLVVIDLLPGGESPMHRTVSVDYSICIIGEIDHELDGGEIVRLKPGDHIVQRGTNHRWINASKTEPARFIAAVANSLPYDNNGKELKEEWQV